MSENKFTCTTEAMKKFREILKAYLRKKEWKRYFFELPTESENGRYGQIEKPMDLSDVRINLEEGLYDDPVAMLEDVWQVFTNAMLYFKGPVDKVKEDRAAIVALFDPLFKELGFCCGDNRDLPELYHHPMCYLCDKRIGWGEPYHVAHGYAHRNDFAPVVCNACHKTASGPVRMVQADGKDVVIQLDEFEAVHANKLTQEKRTPCEGCGRRVHATCLGYTHFHEGPLRCTQCGGPPPTPPTTLAENLPTCALSTYMETKINQFIADVAPASEVERPHPVLVRVVASVKQTTGFDELMRTRYNLKPMDCVLRSIFVFEKLADGKEVCFFAFRVLEFDDRCTYLPNRRCVYLQYVDSVKLFDPDVLRTKVYQRILLAYQDFARHTGFERIYLWSCPPKKNGPVYIFPSRPEDQLLPTDTRLFNWYVKLLKMGKKLGVVADYDELKEQIKKDGVKSLNEFAYFECDRTADFREEAIKSVDSLSSPMQTRSGKTTEPKVVVVKKPPTPEEEQLREKLYMVEFAAKLKEHKNTFLVIKLKPATKNFVPNNTIVRCSFTEKRTELKYKLQDFDADLGFETTRRAVQATKHVVGMTSEQLKVVKSNCGYCKQPAVKDKKVCSSCAKSSDEDKLQAVADFMDYVRDVEFAKDALEHAVACNADKCSYRLCAGVKLLLKTYKKASVPANDHLKIFHKAVALHKTKCTKAKGECEVPGCEGKPKSSRVSRRAAKSAQFTEVANHPSTSGAGRATRKRAHDASAPSKPVKIARRR